MTQDIEGFLSAIELHRQRDSLKKSLEGLVTAMEMFSARPTDPMVHMTYMHEFSGAKLLLAELGKEAE